MRRFRNGAARMFIDTLDLTAAPLGVDVSFPCPDLEATEGAGESVHLTGEVTRVREGFRITGSLTTRVWVRCARCDRRFSLPIDTDFSLRYAGRAPDSPPEGGEVQLHPDDFECAALDERERIDLVSLAREQVYLALPLKPVCSAECRGLCSRCGADLNIAGCACPAPAPDSRWSALEAIRRRS
jgi:DUF177 domain-containing protein